MTLISTSTFYDSDGSNLLAVVPVEEVDALMLLERKAAIEDRKPIKFPKRDSDGCLLEYNDNGKYQRLYLPGTNIPIKDPVEAIGLGFNFATVDDCRRKIQKDINTLIRKYQ